MAQRKHTQDTLPSGNIACTMVMLNHPNIQVTNELGRELLAVCGPEMTTVRDFLERKGNSNSYLIANKIFLITNII